MQINVGTTGGFLRTHLSSRFGRGAKTVVKASLVVMLAFMVVASSMLAPTKALAAGGSYPTDYNTGSVSCEIDTFTKVQKISVKPGAMSATYSAFYGTVKTWSWVQYSYDKTTWGNWYGTALRSATINGYGAVNPPADTRTFGYGGRQLFVRVQQAYEWYNAAGSKIGATKWLLVDYYTSKIKTPSDPTGIYTQTTGSGGCIFR